MGGVEGDERLQRRPLGTGIGPEQGIDMTLEEYGGRKGSNEKVGRQHGRHIWDEGRCVLLGFSSSSAITRQNQDEDHPTQQEGEEEARFLLVGGGVAPSPARCVAQNLNPSVYGREKSLHLIPLNSPHLFLIRPTCLCATLSYGHSLFYSFDITVTRPGNCNP